MSAGDNNLLPPGYELDDYIIVKELGSGTFGVTYLARDKALDEPVAIKEYFPIKCSQRRYADMHIISKDEESKSDFDKGLIGFENEAKVLTRLRNEPNIVKILRLFRRNGTCYFVMPFIASRELKTVIRAESQLPSAFVENMLLKLLDGLEKLHNMNFLHRDIKPANILIADETDEPILIDFGAARQALGDEADEEMSVILTEVFAAPEQHDAREKLGPSIDIFGLAGVAYNCLTGSAPPKPATRGVRDPYQPLAHEAKNEKERRLFEAVDWGLKLDPLLRPQTIAEWRNGIVNGVIPSAGGARASADDEDGTLDMSSGGRVAGSDDDATINVGGQPIPPQPQPTPKKKGLSPLVMLGGAIAAVLVIGFIAVTVLNSGSSDDEDGTELVETETTRSTSVVNTEWRELILPDDVDIQAIGIEADKPFRLRINGEVYLVKDDANLPRSLPAPINGSVEVRGLENATSVTLIY